MNPVMKKRWMIYFRSLMVLLTVFFWASACNNTDEEADAYGNFEAEVVIVSAQSQGTVLQLDIKEGSELTQYQIVGVIDTATVTIKHDQLVAQRKVIQARLRNIDAQLKVQEEQRLNIVREVNRTKTLLENQAATQQQFDDLEGRLKVLDGQTEVIASQKNIILGENEVLSAQISEVTEQLKKCRIINPLRGIVLEKYVETGEMVTPGKALYKIADMKELLLRVYISGDQLSSVAIGDTVTVLIDASDASLEKIPGVVTWFSSEVEFTPKIIQTREERVNMVYAVKVRVPNNGRLKIGMPGEVVFKK
jgi:HlyD family secretion protein